MKDLELYIHIPFCVRKCNYCDFLSAPADRQVQNAYMEALISEIRERGSRLRSGEEARGSGEKAQESGEGHEADEEARGSGEEAHESCEGRGTDGEPRGYRVVSVFIGGGTPSALEPRWIGRLTEAVRSAFSLAQGAEITMEMNPGTVTGEGLALYKEAGINRLSIGMQSADDGELKRLGRIHEHRHFLDAYRMARETGFDNINVDLMAALPGQTREDHIRNLRAVLELDPIPEHISAYSLILEEGTPFFEMQLRGQLDLPEEELERRMYWDTAELLGEAGYGHYEISNYALPGFACRHNCGYWLRTDYLGFGIGAASLFNNIRFSNSRSLGEYLDHPLGCRGERQELSRGDIMEETMFLGLRMMDGVSEKRFQARFGLEMEQVYGGVISEGIRDGLLEWRGSAEAGRNLALTPRGIDLSNYIMAKFLLDGDP